MDKPTRLDRATVTDAILVTLACFVRDAETLRLRRLPTPGEPPGLISLETGGVRANTRAFWWAEHYPFYVVSTLALLDVPLLNPGEVVDWAMRQQHPDGYFRARGLGRSVRESTYHACALLHLLGAADDRSVWDRTALVDLLRAQQRPGKRRHFAFLPRDLKGWYAEPEVAYGCIASLAALGAALPQPALAVRWLQARQRGGDFKRDWVKKLPYGQDQATFDSVRALALLGAEPLDPGACVAEVQRHQIADGGFNRAVGQMRAALAECLAASGGAMDEVAAGWARYLQAPVSSLRDTVWAVLTLGLLGSAPLDVAACRRRIVQLWDPAQGAFRWQEAWPPGFDLPWITHQGLLAAYALGVLEPPPAPARPTLPDLGLANWPVTAAAPAAT